MDQEQRTEYSETVPGDAGNYGWPAQFDYTEGYIGITQTPEPEGGTSRVLLSPEQLAALIAFVQSRRAGQRSRSGRKGSEI